MKSWIFRSFQIHIFLSVIIHTCNCLATVKMELTMNVKYMTLSCFVTERDTRKNIYLHCPLVDENLPCRENCAKLCAEERCLSDTMIDCRDRGLDTESFVYQIDYVIDGSKRANQGKWLCQYGGISSPPIFVNASSADMAMPSEATTPRTSATSITKRTTSLKALTTVSSSIMQPTMKRSFAKPENPAGYLEYDKLLTKTEVIIAIIGFLVLSVIVNLYFCCRMAFIHFNFKKKNSQRNQGETSHIPNPAYNHAASQVSDLERIYEETPVNGNHTSLLANNGNYLVPTTCPQPPYMSPIPFPGTWPNDATQPDIYPSIPRHAYPQNTDYLNIPRAHMTIPGRESNSSTSYKTGTYYNKSTVNRSTDLCNGHLQSLAKMPNGILPSNRDPLSSSSTGYNSNYTSIGNHRQPGKSNYELSREMMEEADNLLRTASTLLKLTDNGMEVYE